jgi:hypothetical protein
VTGFSGGENVQVGEMEGREEQDQNCLQVAVSCNSGTSAGKHATFV